MRAVALVIAAVAAACAVWLGTAGADFMWELERGDPALASVPPRVDDPHTPRLARRVYLVIIDGLGRSRSGAPFLDSLRAKGLDVGATTHYPSWSRPNYISILTGVPPPASGIRTNYHPMSVPIDSIADRAHQAGLRVAWISNYPVIPPLLLRGKEPGAVDLDALGELPSDGDRVRPPPGFSWAWDEVRREPSVEDVGTVARTLDADLVMIVAGDVDRAGHAKGAASEDYRQATLAIDRALEKALSSADLSKDAILVVADHGHVDRGGHGGLEPEVMEVPLIAAGAGIDKGPPPADARLVDVSPTIAALLGIPAPGHAVGHALPILMMGTADYERRRIDDDWRADAMQRVIDDEDSAWSARETSERRERTPVFAAVLVIAVIAARRAHQRGWIRIEARHAWIGGLGVVAILVAFAWMVRLHLSPSWVPPKSSLINRIAAFSIAGALVQVAATLRFARTLAERCGAAVIALAWAVVPAALALALWPRPEVPAPAGLVLYPALELAGAAGCAAVAISLVVALVMSATRRS